MLQYFHTYPIAFEKRDNHKIVQIGGRVRFYSPIFDLFLIAAEAL